MERLYANYVQTVEAALRERGLTPEDGFSLAVFAALDGLMLQFLTISDPARIRAAVVEVGRLLELVEASKGRDAGRASLHTVHGSTGAAVLFME